MHLASKLKYKNIKEQILKILSVFILVLVFMQNNAYAKCTAPTGEAFKLHTLSGDETCEKKWGFYEVGIYNNMVLYSDFHVYSSQLNEIDTAIQTQNAWINRAKYALSLIDMAGSVKKIHSEAAKAGNYATFLISKEIPQGATVLLSGDGALESIVGSMIPEDVDSSTKNKFTNLFAESIRQGIGEEAVKAYETRNFTEKTGLLLANAGASYITGDLNPVSLTLQGILSSLELGTSLGGFYDTEKAMTEMNSIRIAQKWLYQYYRFGGDENALLSSYYVSV